MVDREAERSLGIVIALDGDLAAGPALAPGAYVVVENALPSDRPRSPERRTRCVARAVVVATGDRHEPPEARDVARLAREPPPALDLRVDVGLHLGVADPEGRVGRHADPSLGRDRPPHDRVPVPRHEIKPRARDVDPRLERHVHGLRLDPQLDQLQADSAIGH